MDISFVNEIEEAGGKFYENGEEKDVLEILKNAGVNSIRLRLWNEPTGGYNNLEKTIAMAKRVKQHGFHFLLNFHYSDYWADPGKQTKPKEWEHLSGNELLRAIENYTKDVILSFQKEGALPDMVQIGNEITSGMLWDDGKVTGTFDREDQWEKFTAMIQAGIHGVEAVSTKENKIQTMIHIDRGGDNAGSRKFFDQMKKYNIEFDIIGLSYYPWWHGPLEDFQENLEDLSVRYEKDIVIVEVAYPWTLTETDEDDMIVQNNEGLIAKYPATVEGQYEYLKDLIQIIQRTPNGRGVGIYYWEPCWIPYKDEWSVGHENNWANLTLFDYEGNKLKSLDAFKDASLVDRIERFL